MLQGYKCCKFGISYNLREDFKIIKWFVLYINIIYIVYENNFTISVTQERTLKTTFLLRIYFLGKPKRAISCLILELWNELVLATVNNLVFSRNLDTSLLPQANYLRLIEVEVQQQQKQQKLLSNSIWIVRQLKFPPFTAISKNG